MSFKLKKVISITVVGAISVFVLVTGISKLSANASEGLFKPSDSLKRYKRIDAHLAKVKLEPVFSTRVLTKDLIALHREAAILQGLVPLENEEELAFQLKSNNLVKVQEGKGYLLGNITHSFAYLTPHAKDVLDQMGYSFYLNSGDSSSFTVTSLTRTKKTQQSLRKRNSNATKDLSTHCFGISFDVSYIRYNGERAWNYERTKILEGVLSALQEQGKIYVIKERKQSCFHITVR